MSANNVLNVGVTCWPGAHAAAGAFELSPGRPALAVNLDPINVVITVPPIADGGLLLAVFLRDLARQADQFADLLDPDDQPGMVAEPLGQGSPRHSLRAGLNPSGLLREYGV